MPDQLNNQDSASQMSEIRDLFKHYVKSGQSLLIALRNLAAGSDNQPTLPTQGTVMAQDQTYLDPLSLKTEQDFTDNLIEQQPAYYPNVRSQININGGHPRRQYGFLPDRQLNMHFDKRTTIHSQAEECYTKKYQILSPQQVRELRSDLASRHFTKSQLLSKYRISHSTLLRYVQRFNHLPESVTWSKKRKTYANTSQKGQTLIRPKKTSYKQQAINEQQHEFDDQLFNENDNQSQFSKVSNSKILGNSLNNLHSRYLFMKELRKLDLSKVIFIDQLCYWKQTSEVSEEKGNFKHEEYGYLKQIHFVIAMADPQVIHWKLKPKKLTSIQFVQFFTEIIKIAKDYTFIMDNHSLHKTEQMKNKIKGENIRVLYLPPCSKELNPITPFYENFKKRLLLRIKSNFPINKLLEATHKMIKEMRNQGSSQSFFSKSSQFWKMAEKKQMFPTN